MDDNRRPPRRVVVTGAARGIGLEISKTLAPSSDAIVLVDVSAAVDDAAAELGDVTAVHAVRADLSDRDQITSLTKTIDELIGGCTILVNNAGIHPKTPDGSCVDVADIDHDQWDRVLAVNLTAPFALSQWGLETMRRETWGRIINMSSRAGRMYSPVAGAHYAASKAGIIGLTKVLAGAGGAHGVTANCVAPGRIRTPLTAQGTGSADLHSEYASAVPVGRIGEPHEVAAVVAFLASIEASYVTGTVVDVNGGYGI